MTEKGAKDVGSFLTSKFNSESVNSIRKKLFKNNQIDLYRKLNGVLQDRNNPAASAQAGRHDADDEWMVKVRQRYSKFGKQGDQVVDVANSREQIV